MKGLTPSRLERELDCFVELGREEYLRKNHVTRRRARSYFILWKGVPCDMKAVVHVARGRPKLNPQAVEVAAALRELGFEIVWPDGSRRDD